MSDKEKRYKDTYKSHSKMKGKIESLDKKIDKISVNVPSLRFYPNKRGIKMNPKRYAYCTSIFLNDSYLPSVLTLGMSMRLMKVKYPSVVLVQDRPHRTKEGEVFPGLSKKQIDDLMLVYDYVIGCDLLEIKDYKKPDKNHFTNNKHYSNIRFYVTKLNVLGLTLFDKVFFLDSSTILNENIDWVFNKYQESTFIIDEEYENSEVGLRGTFCLIKPDMRFFKKAIYLMEHYQELFGDLYFVRGVDEVILFYAIYPHWAEDLFDEDIACNSNQLHFSKENCPIIYYQIYKPFKPILNLNPNIVKELYKNYMIWDEVVKNLLKEYPIVRKYFDSIQDFRQTNFF